MKNMYKLLIIVSVYMVFFFVRVNADEADFKYKENSDGTLTLTSYTGEDKDVAVPMYIDGKKVVRISTYVFYENDRIRVVDIPETVNTIDSRSFYSCINLEKVNIYGDITTFGDMVFSECRDLIEVNFYGSLCYLGKRTFKYCESLEFFICPKGVKFIGLSCFDFCDYLETVILNDELETIEWTFFGNTNLVTLDIPENVSSLNKYDLKNQITVDRNMISLYCPTSITNKLESHYSFSYLKYTNIERSTPIINKENLYLAALNYVCDLGYDVKNIEMRDARENSLGIRVFCKTSPEEMYYICVNQDDEGNPDIIYTRKIDIFEYEKGDVNRDLKIDAGDALEILKYSAELVDLSYANMRIGDFDSNGKATPRDALILLKYVAGISETL